MISSRREDRSSGAAPAEAPARPLLRNQFRPHRRQTLHPRARRRRRRQRVRRVRRGAGSVLQLRNQRDRVAHHRGLHRAARARREFAHPRDVFPALKAIRGHNMAKAAVEMAAWDLFARQRGEPLAAVLGGTRDRIASGVSIGIQRSLDDARRERRARARGRLSAASRSRSSRAGTSRAVEAVRARFGAIPLMVDANAAYTLADADHLARARRAST